MSKSREDFLNDLFVATDLIKNHATNKDYVSAQGEIGEIKEILERMQEEQDLETGKLRIHPHREPWT